MIRARHFLPLQVSSFGIHRLPPNHGPFRLLEVHATLQQTAYQRPPRADRMPG